MAGGGEDGGDGEVTDPEGPVQGRVIDYFDNPVPGALVTLAGETVTTDDDGAFAFGPTSSRYSIGVGLEVARFGGAEVSGYLFVGVTRRDPTLQIYRGLPKRSANVTRNVTGVTFPLPSTQKIPMDVAGRYGGFSYPLTSATLTSSGEWEGPAEVQGHVHAIRYEHAAAEPQLPTSYLAHASQPLALDASMTSSFTLDLSSEGPLTAGIISGTAAGSGIGYRSNGVFVRFEDDAAVQVLSHYTSSDAFSYLVPAIASSSIAVAAMRNDISAPPFAVAYVEGIAPGASDVELAIPAPATLLSPATAEGGVDGDTVFSWSGPDQVYMFVADALDVYENFYVITTEKNAKLPVDEVMLPSLRSSFVYEWSVRTHRTIATVDDATGPTGYLDSFCYGRLRGPRRDSGSHTGSELRSFTTAP